MLGEYIELYKKAKEEGNEKEMKRIEKDLAKLGMDRYTLTIIVNEMMKGE